MSSSSSSEELSASKEKEISPGRVQVQGKVFVEVEEPRQIAEDAKGKEKAEKVTRVKAQTQETPM